MNPIRMVDLAKPYGFCFQNGKLVIFLQDAKDETEDTKWGELKIELPTSLTSYLATLEDESLKTVAPVAGVLRQVQNMICTYFYLLHAGETVKAKFLLDIMSSDLNGLAGQMTRGFDPNYGKDG